MNYAIGLDLGGSSVKAVAVTMDGRRLAGRNRDFDANIPMAWAKTVKTVAEELQRECGHTAESMGLSAPGLASADGRSIAFMPGRLHGLENFDWTEALGASKPVPVLNDAHAALLGEVWVGAARGVHNVIMLTLGTGVGGAAMVDGHLLRGQIGRAGHLGHTSLNIDGVPDICGAPGSLEWAIGNATIGERSGGRFATTHELISAATAGDAGANEIWLRSVKHLAAGVCSFINILDPQVVLIGGGVARAGKFLFEPLRRFLDEMEWRPGGHQAELRPATLGEYAGAFGAAANAVKAA
ncbi:MAG: ROK family protein [Pedosphaera sp.]|nr:ROK family protein [Pedosphaera sp.]